MTVEVEAVTPARRWIASRGHSQTTHVILLTDSMSEKWNGKPRLACVTVQHPPSETVVNVLPWTCRSKRKMAEHIDRRACKLNHHQRSASRNAWNVEELETLPAGTNPRASHHRSPGGERRGNRKGSMIFLERKREGHGQSDK